MNTGVANLDEDIFEKRRLMIWVKYSPNVLPKWKVNEHRGKLKLLGTNGNGQNNLEDAPSWGGMEPNLRTSHGDQSR